MIEVLLLICAIIWLPVLIYLVACRGFIVLLVWLLIAPVAWNLVEKPGANPFFEMSTRNSTFIEDPQERKKNISEYLSDTTTVQLKDLLNPSRILFGMFLAVFLLDILQRRESRVPLDKTEMWMIIFCLLLVVNVFLQSRRLAFGLRTVIDAFIIPFIAYAVARRLITTEERFRQLTKVLGCLGCLLIVICFIERLLHPWLLYRLNGPFTSGQILHVVMAVSFFAILLDSLVAGNFPKNHRALFRGGRWFLFYFSPVVILLTLSRGNWAGFLLSLWIVLFLGRRLIKPSQKLGFAGLVLILLPVIMLGVAVFVPHDLFEDRIAQVETMQSRLSTWGFLIREGMEQPIFGVGLNDMRDILATARLKGQNVLLTLHNSYLTLMFEVGIVGFLSYSAIPISIIRRALRLYRNGADHRTQWYGIVVVAVIIDYLIPALFAHTLCLTGLSHMYVYIFVGAVSGLFSQQRSETKPYTYTCYPEKSFAHIFAK